MENGGKLFLERSKDQSGGEKNIADEDQTVHRVKCAIVHSVDFISLSPLR